MLRKYFLLILFAMMFVACKSKIVYEDKYVPVLLASNLYNADSVHAYISTYKDAHKDFAEGYMKQSKEFATTNPGKSLYALKRAITLYPTKEKYLLLVEKLQSRNDVIELNELYLFLCTPERFDNAKGETVFVFGRPDTKLMYEYFIFCVLNKQYYENLDNDQTDNKEMQKLLVKDSRIPFDRNGPEFQNIMLQLLSYEEVKQYASKPDVFSAFLKSIPDSSGELNIDEKNIWHFNYRINYEFDEGDRVRFSLNTVGRSYVYEMQQDSNAYVSVNFIKRFPVNNMITAIVYAVDSSEKGCPVNMRHIYYRLATYAPDTKIIDQKVIASQAGEVFNTVSGNRSAFTITENRRRWENPYEPTAFDNNVAGLDKIRSATYNIDDKGKIITVTQP